MQSDLEEYLSKGEAVQAVVGRAPGEEGASVEECAVSLLRSE